MLAEPGRKASDLSLNYNEQSPTDITPAMQVPQELRLHPHVKPITSTQCFNALSDADAAERAAVPTTACGLDWTGLPTSNDAIRHLMFAPLRREMGGITGTLECFHPAFDVTTRRRKRKTVPTAPNECRPGCAYSQKDTRNVEGRPGEEPLAMSMVYHDPKSYDSTTNSFTRMSPCLVSLCRKMKGRSGHEAKTFCPFTVAGTQQDRLQHGKQSLRLLCNLRDDNDHHDAR